MMTWWRNWLRDQRGAVDLIQFALILPIMILIIFGSYEIWRLVSVKQSLYAGTYQAARYVSLNYLIDGPAVQAVADEIIVKELTNNALLSGDTGLQSIEYTPAGLAGLRPYQFFRIRTTLRLPWPVIIPFLPTQPSITLVEQQTSFVEAGPTRFLPTPTPTP
ncbi:MAG: hypothetical protein FJZ89_01975 [Chloroflexi bacterium]|nr:hypothetical protein [Chloroflexota bacterium]